MIIHVAHMKAYSVNQSILSVKTFNIVLMWLRGAEMNKACYFHRSVNDLIALFIIVHS